MFQSVNNFSSCKVALIALFAIIGQLLMPSFALSANKNAAIANGIIIVCSGFEIRYFKMDANGVYKPFEPVETLPNDANKLHCDACIITAMLLNDAKNKNNYYRLLRQVHFGQISDQFTFDRIQFLSPTRAPPFKI